MTDIPHGDAESQRVRWLLLAAAAVLGASVLGTLLSPTLLRDHPLLLLSLNPDTKFLLLAAPSVDTGPAVLTAGVRRGINLLVVFGLAALYGRDIVRRLDRLSPRVRRAVAWLEGLYERLGIWLVLLVPLLPTAVFAGLARMPLGRFALAMLPGQFVLAAAMLEFGAAISDVTTPVVNVLADNALTATALLVGVMALRWLWRRRKQRGGAAGPSMSILWRTQ